jgi:hypothetical protein
MTREERGAFVHSLARRAFTDGRATAACVMCNLIMLEIALLASLHNFEHDISHAVVESAT